MEDRLRVIPAGEVVGDLWVNVGPAKQRAFITFIGIDEAQRGRGYTKSMSVVVESGCRGEARLARRCLTILQQLVAIWYDARAAMLTVEAVVKPAGSAQIGLHVFGDNVNARHLDESLGYEPAAISMRNEI